MYIAVFKNNGKDYLRLMKAIELKMPRGKWLFVRGLFVISVRFPNSMMVNLIILTDCVNHSDLELH